MNRMDGFLGAVGPTIPTEDSYGACVCGCVGAARRGERTRPFATLQLGLAGGGIATTAERDRPSCVGTRPSAGRSRRVWGGRPRASTTCRASTSHTKPPQAPPTSGPQAPRKRPPKRPPKRPHPCCVGTRAVPWSLSGPARCVHVGVSRCRGLNVAVVCFGSKVRGADIPNHQCAGAGVLDRDHVRRDDARLPPDHRVRTQTKTPAPSPHNVKSIGGTSSCLGFVGLSAPAPDGVWVWRSRSRSKHSWISRRSLSRGMTGYLSIGTAACTPTARRAAQPHSKMGTPHTCIRRPPHVHWSPWWFCNCLPLPLRVAFWGFLPPLFFLFDLSSLLGLVSTAWPTTLFCVLPGVLFFVASLVACVGKRRAQETVFQPNPTGARHSGDSARLGPPAVLALIAVGCF